MKKKKNGLIYLGGIATGATIGWQGAAILGVFLVAVFLFKRARKSSSI